MTDEAFWLAMRGALLGMAAACGDNDNMRRSILNAASLIELRYMTPEDTPLNVTTLPRVEQQEHKRRA